MIFTIWLEGGPAIAVFTRMEGCGICSNSSKKPLVKALSIASSASGTYSAVWIAPSPGRILVKNPWSRGLPPLRRVGSGPGQSERRGPPVA